MNTIDGNLAAFNFFWILCNSWDLQYAVMKIREGKYKWNVWLHPDGGGIDSNTDLLPDDVKDSVS